MRRRCAARPGPARLGFLSGRAIAISIEDRFASPRELSAAL